MKYFFYLFTALALSACNQHPNAQKIIDQSIAYYGMNQLENKAISFDFRESHFMIQLQKENYFYEKTYHVDSLGEVKDQLSNHGFVREVNGLVVPLNTKDSLKYAASVNSVVYFALLPLKLNDVATKKRYLKTVTIKGKSYDEIEVSFQKENGGKDHDDVFYFWFNSQNHGMQFLAYSSGGKRFRAQSTQLKSKGIILQNYVNYKVPVDEKTSLIDGATLYEQNKLIKLSDIILENLKVDLLK